MTAIKLLQHAIKMTQLYFAVFLTLLLAGNKDIAY